MTPIEEDDSSSGFGATGVFQIRSTPGQPPPAAARPPAAVGQAAPQIPQQGGAIPGALPRTGEFPAHVSGAVPVQPVVHSVVFPAQNAVPVDEGARLRQLLHDQSVTPPAPVPQVAPAPPVAPGPAIPAAPKAAQPVAGSPAYPAGGFTQLLRTLEHRPNIDPPAAAAARPVVPAPAPPSAQAAPSAPYPPASFAQVPVGQTPPPPARKPESEPGSFTSLFSSLGPAEPAPAAAPLVAQTPPGAPYAPPPRAPIPVPPAPVARPAAAPAGGNPAATAGSFTQLMQVLGSPDTGMLKSSPAAPVTPAAPVAAQQAKPVAPPIPPAAAPARPAPAPMQERFVPTVPPIAAPPPNALQHPRVPQAQAPQAPVPPAPPAHGNFGQVNAATPPAGSFTQLMQVLGTGNSAAPQHLLPSAPNFSAGPSGSGSNSSAPPAQAAGDLSFTQLSMGRVNSDWSANQPLEPGIGGVAQAGSGLASRPDSWPAPPSAPPRAPQFGEMPRSPRETPGVQAPEPPRPMGGGLTQLLHTLDQPDAAPPKPVGLPGGFAAPQPAAGGQGIFTQTYGQLTDTPPPVSPPAPQPSAPPVYRPAVSFQPGQSGGFDSSATTTFQPNAASFGGAPPLASGQSEFTKILNASQLREANLYGAPPATGAGGAPAGSGAGTAGSPAPGAGIGQFQFPPMQPPPMPPMQMQPPQMPQGQMPAGMAPQFQHPQFPNPQFPQPQMPPMTGAFAQPQAAPPPPAPAADPPAAKPPQNLLPLILIMVIFVLVAVIVALLVTMKH